MDDRIVQFIAGLRASGVRVSLAESQDAFQAVSRLGVSDREAFKLALRSTLVKERSDHPTFDSLFPKYFGTAGPPPLGAEQALGPQELEQLRQALQMLAGRLSELLQQALAGQRPSTKDIDQAMQQAGARAARGMRDESWLTRRTLEQMGLADLREEIEALLQFLAMLGMTAQTRDELRALLEGNIDSLSQQVQHQVGARLAEMLAHRRTRHPSDGDVIDRPLQALSAAEMEELRHQVARMAARLRTRAALRHKRGEGRTLDAKATLRSSIHFGGVPFELIHKVKRRKPKFTVICDVSTSMRPVVYFLLLFIYQIQDQVSRTRSFAFIDHLEEISQEFETNRPEVAIPSVLYRLPPGHYNTDLGFSLSQLVRDHLDTVDGRTTLIVCGDGRNNFNDPRTDLMQDLSRRARKAVWFNPEPPSAWGMDDSDMLAYAPVVDNVFQVSTLRQLGRAIDQLFL
jgi:uncharacterized protein with von Willebrand factor type A (vWA) domain